MISLRSVIRCRILLPALLAGALSAPPMLMPVTVQAAGDAEQLPEACRRPPAEKGDCKALFTVAYYDADQQACNEVFYGGCGGVVPFQDVDECRAACEKGEALRLLEYRKLTEPPRVRLLVSHPLRWGTLQPRVLVNDAEAAGEVVARRREPDRELLEIVVPLGQGNTGKVGVEATFEGQLHSAFVRVFW